jgi:hypothetical protein
MKVVVAAALLVVGAATALATVAVHQLWWGFLLGTAATVAALLALPRGWWIRTSFGLGWVGFVAWVAAPRSEGDFAISSDAAGYTLLLLALVVLVWSVVTLPRPGRPSPAASEGQPRMTR